MVKTMLIGTLYRSGHRSGIAVALALLSACAPSSPAAVAVPPIPPGPTEEEVADYAIAQMHYRDGLATGNRDLVAAANETFRQIPREIFSRQAPRLFAAELVCERYRVAGPGPTSMPSERECLKVEWRYDAATNAIRRDLEARIAAANFAAIAQASAAHP